MIIIIIIKNQGYRRVTVKPKVVIIIIISFKFTIILSTNSKFTNTIMDYNIRDYSNCKLQGYICKPDYSNRELQARNTVITTLKVKIIVTVNSKVAIQ